MGHSAFEATLRDAIRDAQQAIAWAEHAGRGRTVEVHTARLADLLDLATRHGINTNGWLDPPT